jgi:hypothetical protein
MTRPLLTCGLLLALAVPAPAQTTTYTITLTPAQTHAVKVMFGSDDVIAQRVQGWIDERIVQFMNTIRDQEQRQLREALSKLTPEQEARVRQLLAVPTPAAVTAEERAARSKAEQDQVVAETKRLAAAVEAERARLRSACEARNKTLPPGEKPVPCEALIPVAR